MAGRGWAGMAGEGGRVVADGGWMGGSKVSGGGGWLPPCRVVTELHCGHLC